MSWTWRAALLLLAAFLLAYLPDLGHGFVSDDFRWIASAQDFLRAPSVRLLTETTGFFRPLVTLSFAANHLVTGHAAFGYGLVNLLLVLGCAMSIFVVCKAEQLSPAAALIGAGAWVFNFHGINMATLWISGRTSLLLTLCALLAAQATLRRKPWRAALWCLAALCAKEEAIALPVILAAWSGRARWPIVWPIALPLPAYFAVRGASDAFWPTTAPDYYRFTFEGSTVATNILQYADRACTTAAIVAVVLMLSAGRRFHWETRLRRPVVHGLVWLLGAYAITVWLPVRSSLYAVFPSVGTALILAAFADALWVALDSRARRRAAVVLLLLPFLLNPIYRSRNLRWVELADLTQSSLMDIAPHVPALRGGARLVVMDAAGTRATVGNAFGNHLPDAIEVMHGVRPQVEIVEASATTAPSADPRRPTFSARSPASP